MLKIFEFFKNGFKLLIPEYFLIAFPPISGAIKLILALILLIELGNILSKLSSYCTRNVLKM